MNVYIVGDSVAKAEYTNVGWSKLLRNFVKPEGVDVINLSKNGATSADILKCIKENGLKDYSILSIIFAFGVNDSAAELSNQKTIIDICEFEKNVSEIIAYAKSYTNKIYFVEPVLGDESMLKSYEDSFSYRKALVKKFSDVIKLLSQKNDCIYIPAGDCLQNDDFLEGLHPNDSGHDKIFSVIKNYF